MVVFHCGSCGEALKKNQVDKHVANNCRRVQRLSCIDCGKDFDRNSYKEHTKCVTEQEKYGGANYTAPNNINKGEKKQNQWFEIVQSAINQNTGSNQAKILLKKLQYYPNTPRKRAKFINFTNNSIKDFHPRVVEEVWSILEGLLPKPGNNDANQTKKNESEEQHEQPVENEPSKPKRPHEETNDEPAKKLKTEEENAVVPQTTEEEEATAAANARFEWYDEIKLVLSKANERTLGLEALKKKIAKRYKKLKPNQEKDTGDLFKKLEKKLRRAPFVEEIQPDTFRLTE